MGKPAPRPVGALAFGALGFVLSLGLLVGLIDGRILARATGQEVVLAAVGSIAAAAMSVVVLSDSVGLRRRSRQAAQPRKPAQPL